MTSGKNNQFTKSFERMVQYDKRRSYHISIPKLIAEKLKLEDNSVLRVSVGRNNKIVMEKCDIVA